ncbi:leukocidin family pore-forming toxin [Clostridium botulinum]|uniref:Alpha hemolysin n=1 Tax=Clostridium botulinum TaxID=1491 RepID=A0A9Q1UXS6_CLOBO|nr:leukocidin family pore-forming toxin [Clostridium botulinum]AEB74742.1 alpha hemolysin [Clostridium botulinum BKT015925]KEI02775.1 alpha hemolysin [Clostridium botulinum D str. 16868]KEI03097.1 alpha hemolysin [Clostridium botulinum C/D str. Sp77]KLU74868.1 alpha hemolysin [Clostridium botulinum V891]KOA75886.1 alpha hemolysin [Clostridium botulinum]
MLKLKKINSLILSSVLLLGMSINFSSIQANAIESTDHVKTYTSTDVTDNNYNHFKTTLSVTFIEDDFDNQLTALVSTEGSFIPSGLTRLTGSYYADMYWPSTYRTIIKSQDKNNSIKIAKSIPSNQIKTSRVSETMGYSIGGNISVEGNKDGGKASGGVSGSYNASRSVSYDQPEYNTLLKKDSKTAAEWQVSYNENKDGYNRNSSHGIYGNQLFMKSRLGNWGTTNLTDLNDLSSLITGGFSPKVVVALKAPKGTKTSGITVDYTRFNDKYSLKWDGAEWVGQNNDSVSLANTESTFLLDWENHTVKSLYN